MSNKTYNVLIEEVVSGTLEIEANSPEEAREKVQAMIEYNGDNPELMLPDGFMNDSDGFYIKDLK